MDIGQACCLTQHHLLTGVFEDGTPVQGSARPQTFQAITIHLIKNQDFLSIVFDSMHNQSVSATVATQQGLASNFPTFQALTLEQVLRQDYLWQDHCFECFIATDATKESCYLEINLASEGAFNLYFFEGYRYPDEMPPRRLERDALSYGKDINFFSQPITSHRVFWHTASREMLAFLDAIEAYLPTPKMISRTGMCLATDALYSLIGGDGPYLINPCRVLNHGDTTQALPAQLSYWSVQPANPPDFHDKAYWLTF